MRTEVIDTSRRWFCTSAIAALACPFYARKAWALDTSIQWIWMTNKFGKKINVVFCEYGTYHKDALQEITYEMRDHYNGKVHAIDRRVLEILWHAHVLLDVAEPYFLISGYRSPETNEMLRRRGSGVAKNSLHLKGKAADVRLNSRSVGQIARAAKQARGGGVGSYAGSNFVHMDCGPVRYW